MGGRFNNMISSFNTLSNRAINEEGLKKEDIKR